MESIKNNCRTEPTGSSTNVTPVGTSPERFLQSVTNSAFRTVYKNLGIETQKQKPVMPLERAIAINDEGPSPKPPEVATERSLLASTELHATMRYMTRKDAERAYVSRLQALITQAAKEVLLSILQTCSEPLKDVLKNLFYDVIERMLMKISYSGAPDDLFHQNFKH